MNAVDRLCDCRHSHSSNLVRNGAGIWVVVAVGFLSAAISGSASDRAAAAQVVRRLALSGAASTDHPEIGLFANFSGPPVIDNRGNVAFIAGVGGGASQPSVWVANDSELRLIARSATAAPNAAAEFLSFADLTSAQDGVLAFKATLRGSATNAETRDSIWLYQPRSLQLVARAGWEAPNPSADLRFSAFETPVTVSRTGHVAFFARTRDKEVASAQGSGLWVAQPNGVAFAAIADGDAISGQPGVVFSPQSFEAPFAEDPAISPIGQSIFRGFLFGPGVDETNLNGLWSYSHLTGLQLLLRAGDHVDGMDGTTFLSFPGIPTINAAGDTAFLAFVGAPHPTSSDLAASSGGDHEHEGDFGLGVWLRRASGQLSRVFMIGDNAPGIDGHAHFVDVFDPVMNASGRVALVAAVEGDAIDDFNEAGLWSNGLSRDAGLRLVAWQGNQAPGADKGFVFGVFLEPSLNARGQSAFMAAGYRQEGGEILDSGVGIWGQTRSGQLQLVALVGQMLEVAPGDDREITALGFSSGTGGEDGRARGLNDLGQVAFQATFSDGSSGIFISDALTVPEPGSLALALLVLALASFAHLNRRTTKSASTSASKY
jgi:hypothetical protein